MDYNIKRNLSYIFLGFVAFLFIAAAASLRTIMYDKSTLFTYPVSFKGSVVLSSNYTLNIPSSSSTVTIHGTNQHYRLNTTSNVTFESLSILKNVRYMVMVTNLNSTITWPDSWRWIDGPLLSTPPVVTYGSYILNVLKNDDGTNAWIEVGKHWVINASSIIGFTTNSSTGVITPIVKPSTLSNLVETTIDFSANAVSNISAIKRFIQLPAITTSNILVSFETNNYELVGLTNVILTNIIEQLTGVNAKTKIVVRNTIGTSIPVILPAHGAQHGYYFHTNGFSDILQASAAPPGTNTIYSLEADGTNIYGSVSYWIH